MKWYINWMEMPLKNVDNVRNLSFNKAKQANKVRRVDRGTNALPTDRPTDQPTDGHSQLQRCFVALKTNDSRSHVMANASTVEAGENSTFYAIDTKCSLGTKERPKG